MDPYNQAHNVPTNMQHQHHHQPGMSTGHNNNAPVGQSTQTTSNYVVQLDPNSGHFELLPSARTVELTGCENDEAVYKIRDEDFYIRGPLTDQGFSEIDIDPVMDMGDIFSRNMQQTVIQPQQTEQVNLQMQSSQQMPSTTMQFVQQSQNHQISHYQNHPIQAQLQIQPSQNQPQMNYALEEVGGMGVMPVNESYQIHTTPTGGTGSGQVSGTIMSIVSSFISPGATALQVDNNLIIYNPSGQIIQIPLPSQGSSQSQPVISTSNIPSSSGLQYQNVPVSANTSDFGWIDSALASSSNSVPSTSHQLPSDYSSSTIQSQYSVPSTIQYSTAPDHHNNQGFTLSTSSADQDAIADSYYNLQNVELLPTSSSYPPAPTTQSSLSTTFSQIPELESTGAASNSTVICNDNNVDDFQDIIVKPMYEDETDSSACINAETQKFLESIMPIPITMKQQPTVTIEQSPPVVQTVIQNLPPSPPSPPPNEPELKPQMEIQPVSSTASVSVIHSVIKNVTEKSVLDPEIKYCPKSKLIFKTTRAEKESENLDDFDIKIVFCFSIPHETERQKSDLVDEPTVTSPEELKKVEIKVEKEDVIIKKESEEQILEPCQIKCEEIVCKPEILEGQIQPVQPFPQDGCRFLKEIRKLEPIVPGKRYPTPSIPPWLSGYVDDDDELLVAFKNRSNPMKTDICQLCYTWFFNRHDLKQHIKKRHSGAGACHCCSVCGARFVARVLRLRHEKLHKYDLKHRSIVYLRQPDLKSHFAKRFRPAPLSPWYASHIKKVCNLVERLPFTCFDCGVGFSSSEYVQDHYERVHATQVCGTCGKRVENSKTLIQHEQEFHGHYTITENYVGGAWNLWDHWLCEESIKREVILSNIAYFHNYVPSHEDIPKLFEEDFIERSLEVEGDGLRQAPKYEDQAKSFGDSSFSASFDDDNMDCCNDAGIRLPFACKSCSKSYDNEFDLKRHVKVHGSPSKANLACQYCGRVFKTHSHKKEHERTHTGEKPYVCPVCQRSFIQSSNLKKHMQTHQHSSLQCGTCGKQFIKEASLILHQRAHAQDRKFRCAICDRAYNYASLLKRHMRIHTGEMPYSCESCGMLFHELVSLHYHRKKVHTGERPHKCDTCGRAFILSSDLKKHVQIHLKPQSDRPVSLRKRSQSKSLDRSDNLDTPSSSPNSKSPSSRTLGANFISTAFISEDNHSLKISEEHTLDNDCEEEDEEENRSILSPSPCSSLENEIITNKPAIVRVYARRDPKPLNPNFPTFKEKEIELHQKIESQSTTFHLVSAQPNTNSPNSNIPAGTQQLMQIDNNLSSTIRRQHHQLAQNSSVADLENHSHQQIIATQANDPVVEIGGYHYSLSSTEDAALLLSINSGDFHHTTTVDSSSEGNRNMVSTFTSQPENNVGVIPKIEEVLQLSGLNEFSDLMVVPEASSEIEIILDDKHHRSMQ